VSWIVVSSNRDVLRLTAVLRSARDHAVVVLTRLPEANEPVLPPEGVREIVGPAVRIYYVASDHALAHLRRTLGAKLTVPGGALRVWWPGLTLRSDPADHPLVVGLADEAPRELLAEFARQFDLSRPRVREELRSTEVARVMAEDQLRHALAEIQVVTAQLRDAQLDGYRASRRIEALEAALARAGGSHADVAP
jgi:hypothetical protein